MWHRQEYRSRLRAGLMPATTAGNQARRLTAALAVCGLIATAGCTRTAPLPNPTSAQRLNPDGVPWPSRAASAPGPRPTLSFEPLPGLTLASVAAALPRSWKISALKQDGGSYDRYVAITTYAVADTQLEVGAVVTWPGSTQVAGVGCAFTRTGIKVDAALLKAAKSCLAIGVPAADQTAANAWMSSTASALPIGTVSTKTNNFDAIVVTVACADNTVGVYVQSRQTP